jgi:DNA modification methylase
LENCKIISEDIEQSPLITKNKIIKGDVRKNLKNLKGEKFKLCITSPPYLNSFDYSDIYRPELFLGKYVRNNTALTKLRKKTVRSHMQTAWRLPQKTDFGMSYQNCFNEILKQQEYLWNPKIPIMIQAYFEDMENVLTELFQKADKNASLWIVVSTSAYVGIEIPVDFIIAEIGSKIGWVFKEVVATRNMRNSSQNAQKLANDNPITKRLRESIVILKKDEKNRISQ